MNSESESPTSRFMKWVQGPVPAGLSFKNLLHRVLRIILVTLRESQINSLSLRSGALTYTLLLSMVPMLAMSTALVKGLGGGNQLREVVYSYIDRLEEVSQKPLLGIGEDEKPGEPVISQEASSAGATGLTNHLRSAANQLFDYVDRTNFATLGTFGMLGIFLSVILVLNHIESAMNAIWHVTAGRSLLRKLADYITLMVLLPLSINVTLAAGTILESQALSLKIAHYISADWVQMLVLQGVPIFFMSVTLYVLYLFFPNTKPKTVPTLIGAVTAGTLWFLTQNIYISLQVGVAKYNAIYGSFATVPLFLVWIYFGWLFILLGAQLSYAIQNHKDYQLAETLETPVVHLSAALDITDLVTKRFQSRKETTLDDLVQKLPMYTLNQINHAESILVSAGLLHHAKESGGLKPSVTPESITSKEVVTAVLGTNPPVSSGGQASSTAVSAAAESVPDKDTKEKPPSPSPNQKDDS